VKKSTREFISEAKNTQNYSFWDLVHGYVYMCWPYLYISIGKGDHPLANALSSITSAAGRLFPDRKTQTKSPPEGRGFAEGYHGKVLPLETAKELVSIKQDIRVENLEQVVPFERARDIILKNPDHIAVIDCPCRKGMDHHCEPMDVCLIVGEPFVSFMLEHQPDSSRAITSSEAKQILEDEARRGHVSHAFFKDAVLNRFYAICNCCSCCCGAMKAQRNGTPMIFSSGFVSHVDQEICTACGVCVESCQFGAISLKGKLLINEELCMGCGVCVSQCPQHAFALALDPTKPAPLEISHLV